MLFKTWENTKIYNIEMLSQGIIQYRKKRCRTLIIAFLEEVRKAGYTLRGPFFYTINSKLEENQDVLMELFIPVEEEYIEDALPEDFLYHSLFQVLNTVSTRILEPDES